MSQGLKLGAITLQPWPSMSASSSGKDPPANADAKTEEAEASPAVDRAEQPQDTERGAAAKEA